MYYRADEKENGVMYKRVYVTVNDTYNTLTCFKIPGSADAPVSVQSILPNMTAYSVSTIVIYSVHVIGEPR